MLNIFRAGKPAEREGLLQGPTLLSTLHTPECTPLERK